METIKLTGRLTMEEKECHLSYDPVNKMWTMDTMVMKLYNKAKRQGWKQLKKYIYEDGLVCGGAFEAPARAITIRNAEKKQMSEKQLGSLSGNDEEDDE